MLLVISYSPHIRLLLMYLDIKTFLYFVKQAVFIMLLGKSDSLFHISIFQILSVRESQSVVSGPVALAWPRN